MPLVGVNNEPLLERAIFGFDGTSYRVVKVDTDGNLVAAVKASQAIEVTQDTAADLKATVTIPTDQDIEARGYGWLGSAWQKAPIPFGYSGVKNESWEDTNLASGNSNVDSSAVPAGEIWVILQYAYHFVGTVPTRIYIQFGPTSDLLTVFQQESVTSVLWESVDGMFILEEGDILRLRIIGATSGDDLTGRAHGYRIDIDQ